MSADPVSIEFGEYRLVRRLGTGGMAEVFEAIAVGPAGVEKRVAIKKMLPGIGDDTTFARMFFDEARIVSQLQHGGIVSILDYGLADGTPFQVLEYVRGVDLRELLRARQRQPIPVSVALHIATEVAHALAYAHSAVDVQGSALGIVHRDVSPANILVSSGGEVKLTDFGIARAEGRVETTQVGIAKGTPGFMAPEQLLGTGIDPRADVFGLACTLNALLTGESPLHAEGATESLLRGNSVALSPMLQPDVAEVLQKALSPTKAERHGSAAELATSLGRLLSSRVSGDGKSHLRDWLHDAAVFRDSTDRRDLFDLALVVTSITDGVKEFTAKRDTAAESPSARRRPFRRGWLIAGLILMGLCAAGLAAIQLSTPSRPESVHAAAVGDGIVAPPPSLSAATPPPVIDAGRLDASMIALPPPPKPDGKRADHPRRRTTGRIVVGGPGALRAQIKVNGKSVGHGPKTFALPVGRHRIVVLRHDGSTRSRTVRITKKHKGSNPYRWIVAD